LAIRQGFFCDFIPGRVISFVNNPFIVKYFYICKQSNNKSIADAEKQIE
jgi:hypothetical protein